LESLLAGDEWSSSHYRCFNLAEKAPGTPKQGGLGSWKIPGNSPQVNWEMDQILPHMATGTDWDPNDIK
jgi:hypothetical protein